MLVQGNLNQARSSSVDQHGTLFIVSVFEEFLAQVVAKGI